MKSIDVKSFLFGVVLSGLALPLLAHDPGWVVKVRHLTMADGLSSRFVTQIYQDTDDFMWFVTSEGLNRYDGYRMDVFNPRQMGAKTDYPVQLLEDCAHHIWLISRFSETRDGSIRKSNWKVEVLDPYARKLITGKVGLPVPDDRISAMAHIPGYRILAGTTDGRVFAYDGGYFLLYQDMAGRAIRDLQGGADGAVAVVVGSEIISLDREGSELGRAKLPGGEVWKMKMDEEGNLWVVFRDNVGPGRYRMFILQKAGLRWEEVPLPGAMQREHLDNFDIAVRKEGSLVLHYPGFLGLYDKKGSLEADLTGNLGSEGIGISPGNLFIDRQGAIWGVQPNGVARLTFRPNAFRHYLHHPPFSIRGMTWVSDSVMFVANYTQELLLNVRSGAYSPVGSRSMANLGAARDGAGNFWAGRHLEGFVRYSPDFSTIEAVPASGEPSRIPRPKLDGNIPFQDSRGQLWFGLSKGLGYRDEENGQISLLRARPPFTALMEHSVNAFWEDGEGIWLGTSGGLFRMDHSGNVLFSAGALSRFYIFHIYRDGKGRFWLATRGDGLVCWDPATGSLRKFDSRAGFISDIIYAVIADEQGCYWLPTNKGLIRFDPKTFHFAHFNEADGMANSEFNYLASLKGPDGCIYVGGLTGITAFHPDSIRIPETLDIPLRVRSVLEWAHRSGRITDITGHWMEKGEIPLFPPNQSFSLTFSPLDFQIRREDQYAFWLEGLERGWTFLNKPEISLSRLPPGRYILHVNARGENGLWSKEELRIPVMVKEPFFDRPLFWIFLVLSVGGVGFLYYRWHLWRLETQRAWLEAEVGRRTSDLLKSQRLVREQNLQLGRLNQTKDQLFLILAHELKNPVLSFRQVSQKITYLLNRGQMERLRQLGAELDRTASSAHNLLDNLLQWAKTQRGTFALHPRIIHVREAFSRVIDEYRDRAEEKNLRLLVNLDEEDTWVWADPAALQILLRNLADNAVKFTQPGGSVLLCAEESDGGLSIRVKDTGVGMQPEKLAALFRPGRKPTVGTAGERGSGLGLLLMKELMDLHNGAITAVSEEGKGTAITLWFPPREKENTMISENNLVEDE